MTLSKRILDEYFEPRSDEPHKINLCTNLICMLTFFQKPAVKSPLVLQNLMNSKTWFWPRLISFLVFSNMSLVFSIYIFASWRKQDEPIPLKMAESMSSLIFEYFWSESFLFSITEVFCEYGTITLGIGDIFLAPYHLIDEWIFFKSVSCW